MGLKSVIYRGLRFSNDVNAVDQAVRRRSLRPVVRRAARRAYGRATGRLAGRLFR